MSNRYNFTNVFINSDEKYSDLLLNKKLNNIKQYETFNYGNLKDFELYGLDTILHTVSPSEKIYNISSKYYNSPDYGWLICYTNKISSELELKVNDTLIIYYPLETLLELLNG